MTVLVYPQPNELYGMIVFMQLGWYAPSTDCDICVQSYLKLFLLILSTETHLSPTRTYTLKFENKSLMNSTCQQAKICLP